MASIIGIILLYILTKSYLCIITGGSIIVDLNTILKDLSESCHTSIQTEKDIELRIMNFPILYTFTPKNLFATTSQDYYFSKFIFCRVHLIIFKDYKMFRNGDIKKKSEEALQSQTMQYCSLIHSHLSEYSWTNCMILILGVGKEIRNNFFHSIPLEFRSKKLWISEIEFGLTQAQFYVMFLLNPSIGAHNETIYDEMKPSEMIYICRICTTSQDSLHQVSIQGNKSLQKSMEDTARAVTGNGKNILLPITSYLEPPNYNMSERIENFAFGPKADSSFLEKKSASDQNIEKITMTNYYFRFRFLMNYVQIIQRVLFENVPQNVTIETVENSVANSGSDSSFASQSKAVTLDKYLYSAYGKKLYLDRKDYFNFITCHGLRKSENFAVYLMPFNGQIWFVILSILILCTMILIIRLRKFVVWPILHHISLLLENTSGHIHKVKFAVLGLTGKLLFFCVAFLLIVMGNLYKGIITRDIILPITSTIPYSKIDELKDFELIVLPRKFKTEENTTITSKILAGLNQDRKGSRLNNLYSSFGEEIATLFLFPNVDPEAYEYYANIYERMSILPNMNYAYKLLIANCTTKKQAFIGLRNELDSFMEYKDSKSHFAYGKDEYIPINYYWHIPNAAGGYLHERMSMILTSGIEKIWRQIYFKKSSSYQSKHTSHDCYDCSIFDTNLGTLFKLCLFGTVVGLFVFLTEIVISYLHNLITRA